MINRKYIFASIMLLFVFVMTCSFTGCSKDITIVVRDKGTNTEISTKTEKTVSEVLSEANISVATKDQVEPTLDTKISEDTKEITIKRYAKVFVSKDGKKKEVELVGGQVKDAIQKAGFILEKNESTNFELTSFLDDGMDILILREKTVKIKVDGKTKDIKTNAVTVKDFLEEQKIKLSKDDEVTPKVTSKIDDKMTIVIKRVVYKEETRKESIDYSTEEKYDDSMSEGESKIEQEGVEGTKEVKYKVKYVDGKESSKKMISENVIAEPVNQIIIYGTKQGPAGNSDKTEVSRQQIFDCDGSGHGYWMITYSDGTVEYIDF